MKIKVYAKDDCVRCKMTERFLEQHGLDYELKNISHDEKAYADVVASGFKSAPVVEINGQMLFCGLNMPALNKLVNQQ